MLASPCQVERDTDVREWYVFLCPLKVHDLLSTLDMMLQAQQRIRRKLRSRPRERSKEEQDLINEAKALLMERNNMTESEAHRYIQKCSMDSGTNLVETAQMIISLIHV